MRLTMIRTVVCWQARSFGLEQSLVDTLWQGVSYRGVITRTNEYLDLVRLFPRRLLRMTQASLMRVLRADRCTSIEERQRKLRTLTCW